MSWTSFIAGPLDDDLSVGDVARPLPPLSNQRFLRAAIAVSVSHCCSLSLYLSSVLFVVGVLLPQRRLVQLDGGCSVVPCDFKLCLRYRYRYLVWKYLAYGNEIHAYGNVIHDHVPLDVISCSTG